MLLSFHMVTVMPFLFTRVKRGRQGQDISIEGYSKSHNERAYD